MPDISKINAVAVADIEKLDSILAANIEKVNGLTFATAVPISTPAAAYQQCKPRSNGDNIGAVLKCGHGKRYHLHQPRFFDGDGFVFRGRVEGPKRKRKPRGANGPRKPTANPFGDGQYGPDY